MNEAAGEGHDALCDLCSYYKPTEGKQLLLCSNPGTAPGIHAPRPHFMLHRPCIMLQTESFHEPGKQLSQGFPTF